MAAHEECLQALVTWHDPHAKRIFVMAYLATTAHLLAVPMKVAAGVGVGVESKKGFNLFHKFLILAIR